MLQRHDTKAIRCANEQEVKEICKIIVTLGGKDLSRWWNNEPFGNGDFYIFFMKNFSYGMELL